MIFWIDPSDKIQTALLNDRDVFKCYVVEEQCEVI